MNDPRSLRRYTLPGLALRLAVLVGAIAGFHVFIDWALAHAAASANAQMMTLGVIVALMLAYTLLIAIPFVPGIEIGLALLMAKGGQIAPAVYTATVLGLMLAYFAGCKLPLEWLRVRLEFLRLSRAARLVAEVQPLSPQGRLSLLRSRLPGGIAPHAIRWRYVGLAALINLPGSGLIGGGGGICLLAGLTGVFAPRATLLTLAIAVAPIPLLVWFTGMNADWLFSLR